jgi:hypothetical protein
MLNGASGPTTPEQTPPAQLDWKIVAQTAMQQRDRANQLAYNLEIDLIMAQAKIAALEKVSGITAAAALAQQEEEATRQNATPTPAP